MHTYRLSGLLDMTIIQQLADSHYQATGIPIGLVDALDGSILVGAGWQDICTNFHRAHPISAVRCRKSDLSIKDHLVEGEAYQYRCSNGLWDIGIPINVVGQRLATLFLGQFFYEGETPQREFFIQQADELGYDLAAYLVALDRVPVFSRYKVDMILAYDRALARFIADLAEQSLRKIEAEEFLQANEARYRSLFENMLNGFAYCQMLYDHQRPHDFVYLEVNSAFATLTGLKDVVGKRVTEVIPGIRGSDPNLFEIYDRVASTGVPERFEIYLTALDMWFAISAYSPKPGYFVTVFDVITERKRAEAALADERNLLRTLIDHLPAYVYVKDKANRFLIANAAVARHMGATSPDELLGKTDADFYPPERAARFLADEHTILQSGQPLIDHDEPNVNAAGDRRWILTTKLPLRDSHEQIVGLVGIGHDITERKRVEEENQRLNAELEQRVADRTAQLTVANQELEAFAYSVSHDLRSPLRAIDGFSRLILEGYADKLDAEGLRLLNVVRANTQKMDQLITGLLALSRVTRSELASARIDMTALVRTMLRDATALETPDGVEVSIATLPMAYGDPTLIRQVWQNLLANAIKYTLPKAVRNIEVGSAQADGVNIYYVKDNGVGFDPDYGHKLFGVFQRLHRADQFEGTGVGLAIVRRIVHRHGGQTWAEGQPDQGATFYFSLPHRGRAA